MKNEVEWLISMLERAIKEDDPNPGWYLQEYIGKVYNTLPINSDERAKIADIWLQMMIKWH
jgi:hypothetical protein